MRFLISSLMCVVAMTTSFGQYQSISNDEVFQHANKAILEHDYTGAIAGYLELMHSHSSYPLFHNLGIAYYLDGDHGRSILHLERAARLKINPTETLEMLSLIRNSHGIAPPRRNLTEQLAGTLPEWFWAAILTSGFWGAIYFGVYCFWMLKGSPLMRDLAVVCFLLFALGVAAVAGLQSEAKQGVLVSAENGLQIVPTQGGEIFRTLQAGEMGRLIQKRDHFVLVETSSRVRGWTKSENFKLIRD